MSNAPLLDAYHEHERDLIRFLAGRLKCLFTAHDLAQEVYLKVQALEDASAIRNRRAYLFRMAANLATDHLRLESRRAELNAEAHALLWGETDALSPERMAIGRQELARLQRAAAGLPPLSRRIFHLNRFAGRTQREIAAELGVSLTTVEKHVRRVLDHLARARDGEA